ELLQYVQPVVPDDQRRRHRDLGMGGAGTFDDERNPCIADGKWDSGVQNDPFSFSFTFTSAGTYPYFCTVHCISGMTRQIIVQAPPAPPPATAPSPTPTTTPTASLPTSTVPAPTATVVAPGTVPTLSTGMLALLGLALGGAALLLIKRP